MNLVIEYGNTNLKVATFKEDALLETVRLRQDDKIESLNYLWNQPLEAAIISGSGNFPESIWSRVNAEKKLVLDTTFNLPIDIQYFPQNSLGKDRVINAYFANKLYPTKSNLIIDCGTCITFTFVSVNKTVLGGSISPGLRMRLKSLHHYTASLPLIQLPQEYESFLIGNNTEKSILSGVVEGIIYEMNGRISEYHQKFDNLNIIITGGDALFFENKINYQIFADADFTLKGLNDVLQHL